MVKPITSLTQPVWPILLVKIQEGLNIPRGKLSNQLADEDFSRAYRDFNDEDWKEAAE